MFSLTGTTEFEKWVKVKNAHDGRGNQILEQGRHLNWRPSPVSSLLGSRFALCSQIKQIS